MGRLKIKDVVLGEGKTKICVPIVANTKEEILKTAKAIAQVELINIVEVRIDYFFDVTAIDQVIILLTEIRRILKDKVLLFTFRTSKEGGYQEITPMYYSTIYHRVMDSVAIDMIDIEYALPRRMIEDIIAVARQKKISIIISNHDQEKTPFAKEMIRRMIAMDKMGGDIIKVAYKAMTKQDVLSLLEASLYIKRSLPTLMIAISMGEIGIPTRLIGDWMGSCVTFASFDKASALGQLSYQEASKVIELYENNKRQLF